MKKANFCNAKHHKILNFWILAGFVAALSVAATTPGVGTVPDLSHAENGPGESDYRIGPQNLLFKSEFSARTVCSRPTALTSRDLLPIRLSAASSFRAKRLPKPSRCWNLP
jgi:hypothetical protein